MENVIKDESLTFEEIYSLIGKYEEKGIELNPEYGVYRNSLTMRIANYFGSEGDRNSRILANLVSQRVVEILKSGRIV